MIKKLIKNIVLLMVIIVSFIPNNSTAKPRRNRVLSDTSKVNRQIQNDILYPDSMLAINHSFDLSLVLNYPSQNLSNELYRIDMITTNPFIGFSMKYNYHFIKFPLFLGLEFNIFSYERKDYKVDKKNYRQSFTMGNLLLSAGWRMALLSNLDIYVEGFGGYITYSSDIEKRSDNKSYLGKHYRYSYSNVIDDNGGLFEYGAGLGLVIKVKVKNYTWMGLKFGYEFHKGRPVEMVYYQRDSEKIYNSRILSFTSDFSVIRMGIEFSFMSLKK